VLFEKYFRAIDSGVWRILELIGGVEKCGDRDVGIAINLEQNPSLKIWALDLLAYDKGI
jgi:hypothetical protein